MERVKYASKRRSLDFRLTSVAQKRLCLSSLISLLCLTGSGAVSIHEERLQISEAGRKQNKSIWNHFKSLARFSIQFREKKSFKLLLAIQVKKIWS